MKRLVYFFPLILLILSSCIGTDFVDEPLGPVPVRLDLSDNSIVLLEGENQQLSAKVIASDESEMDIAVSWNSRDAAIASIDESGLATAVAVGQVWIDVTTQTLADSVLVTVSADPQALASIEILGGQSELTIDDSLQLDVVMRNANGDVLSGKEVSWESSNPTVGAINQDGLVRALADGTTEITARAEGLKSLPYSLTVNAPGTDSVILMGTFTGVNGYNVQGTATLVRAETSELKLGSDFRTANGPGLYVYLSPNSNNVTGGVSLGLLQNTTGEQTYAIPTNVNLEGLENVIIYCQPFRVPFGVANLE
ncbi:MAG: DM13 domain-containing protein [Bacteroidia bacterium]|nr:DM13 domain-containing protein [Bacteroidia bacterium]